MTRAEHLEWCKQRALAYLPDKPMQALVSMLSDLRKHPELEQHPAARTAPMGKNLTADQVADWMEGVN